MRQSGRRWEAWLCSAPYHWECSAGGTIVWCICFKSKIWICRYVVRLDADEAERPALGGLALLCSMPPSGNSGTAGRIMKRTPLLGARLTWCAACLAGLCNCYCRSLFQVASLQEVCSLGPFCRF